MLNLFRPEKKVRSMEDLDRENVEKAGQLRSDAHEVGEMTDKEFTLMHKEITERAIDIFKEKYCSGKVILLDKRFIERIGAYDKLSVEYKLDFIGNDIVQMLGRIRREEE